VEIRVHRAPRIEADIRVPGDKSISHRSALLAALKSGMADLIGPLPVSSSARYEGPFRVIRGENSPRVNAEALPLIHHHFPAASLHTVANAGHWPHAEAPVDFMRALNDCLLL
jgi:pimeloyl-ACP methyl ester carboxylesterase